MPRLIVTRQRFSIALSSVVILLLLLLNGAGFILYRQQGRVLEQHRAKLDSVLSGYSDLNEEAALLSDEITRLREKYHHTALEIAQQEVKEKERAAGGGPTAYLTMDDGPSKITVQILEILADYGISATFFVIGFNQSGDEHIYRCIVDEGHALGNHTYTHNLNTIYRSVEAFLEDLLRLEEHIHAQAGVRPDIIRFPGGSSNGVAEHGILRELINIVQEQGYDYFDWNVDTGDANSFLPAGQLVGNVLTQVDRLQGGDAVILLHDGYVNHNTAEALPQIIEALQERGYHFAPLKKGAINMKHR